MSKFGNCNQCEYLEVAFSVYIWNVYSVSIFGSCTQCVNLEAVLSVYIRKLHSVCICVEVALNFNVW